LSMSLSNTLFYAELFFSLISDVVTVNYKYIL